MHAIRQRRFPAAALLLGAFVWLGSSAQDESPRVVVLSVQDAIGPATSDYIRKGIDHANETGAELVVLELDTPGGLDTSMREIIQSILGSSVPVATYVYPQGARAASAGTYILYASQIAAMAPATNLGAATPVSIIGGENPLPGTNPGNGGSPPDGSGGSSSPSGSGNSSSPSDSGGAPGSGSGSGAAPADGSGDAGPAADGAGNGSPGASSPPASSSPPAPAPSTTMERKSINDAVAYIRSLAERRGRNADWAERAVRASESLSAEAALRMGVIDLIATNLDDLIAKLNGREVDGSMLLLPPNATVIEMFEPDWRDQLLAALTNPTIAYILLLLGIYGLVFEGYNPGAVLPGVVGAISLLLALFAFQILPVNYSGLALILLGVILMLAEFFVPSFGALGIGGVASFVFGSLILIDTDVPGFGIAASLIVSIALTAALALLATVYLALRARQRPVVSGAEQILNMDARALEDFEHEGDVWVHGERWRAESPRPVAKDEHLRVTAINGLRLTVEPAEEN